MITDFLQALWVRQLAATDDTTQAFGPSPHRVYGLERKEDVWVINSHINVMKMIPFMNTGAVGIPRGRCFGWV